MMTPHQLRQKIRSGAHRGNTSGLCAGFVQCNLVILPRDWAFEFQQFCLANPKPCPLLKVTQPGEFKVDDWGQDLDLRSDVPRYRIFRDGQLAEEVLDIRGLWREDLVAFLLGCSFSFEEALLADGLEIRNISEHCNVPMYRTSIDCQSAGRFSSKMVVSMRPFTSANAIRAIQICSRFPSVHGAPVHFGDPASIGINYIEKPDFGDAVSIRNDETPVFWACGVTPQVALEQARPDFCITHSPGCMLVTDVPNSRLAIF